MTSHVRIEAAENTQGLMGHQQRIVYVAADGTETDISGVVQGYTFTGKAGDVNTATLELIKVRAEGIKAELVEATVLELGPAGVPTVTIYPAP